MLNHDQNSKVDPRIVCKPCEPQVNQQFFFLAHTTWRTSCCSETRRFCRLIEHGQLLISTVECASGWQLPCIP